MNIYKAALLAAVIVTAGVAAGPAPAAAQQASATQAKAAGAFVDDLADRAYAVLRDKSNNKTAVKAKFRTLLKANFAITEIGNKLIRRHVRSISPQQYAAYQAAFPDYVVDTYTDNLFEFADSDLRIVRTLPRGARGAVDVYSRVIRNDGAQPIDAIWSVRPKDGGGFLITNLTVAGVNLSLTQEADFAAYVDRNGFDALVAFMKSRKDS
jgi:phospholipid transport system substrate-binding protein